MLPHVVEQSTFVQSLKYSRTYHDDTFHLMYYNFHFLVVHIFVCRAVHDMCRNMHGN